MSDIAAVIAAKARAAAQKVTEASGIAVRASPAANPPPPLRVRPDPGAGEAGTLAGSTDGPSGATPPSRVNGALVAIDPGARAESLPRARHLPPPRPARVGTRWGPLPCDQPAARRGRALAMRTRVEQLTARMESTVPVPLPPPHERSPSPPPEYDRATGRRVNSREQRRWDRWDAERRDVAHELCAFDPSYVPPRDHRAPTRELRVYIPARKHPGYPFVGLIIGPRGKTQKRLERETGARVSIRGRGSERAGARPRATAADDDAADDRLHVHITADTVEKVDRAARLVHPLLTPVDPERNPHKRRQLRELAALNGTTILRDAGWASGERAAATIVAEGNDERYSLPNDVRARVDARYARDVAAKAAAEATREGRGGEPEATGGGTGGSTASAGTEMDAAYAEFMSEVAGTLAPGEIPGHPGATATGGSRGGAASRGDVDGTGTVDAPLAPAATVEEAYARMMRELERGGAS